MSLQPRTTAPGKARRAASAKAGKPRAKKSSAGTPVSKPRHTSAEKSARKGTAAKPFKAASSKPASKPATKRYSDIDTSTLSKKDARLTERSKMRAKRYQEKTASKPREVRDEIVKPESRAKKFVSDRNERTARPEFKKPDTRPTTRRDAAKERVARTDDGRPNFIPGKREKYKPGAPSKQTFVKHKSAPDVSASNYRAERPAKPVRDRRNESPAYARDDRKAFKTHNNAAVDFGVDDNYISANLADANLIDATPLSEVTTTFRDLGIAPALANALNAQGITSPFPIQIATLPDALAGHDILGRGQTGSGKTLAFGLALLTNISGKAAKPHKPLALVLTPTRELAQQIDEVLTPLARSIGHDSVVIAGGMPYAKQITAMRKATAILVATPGRLIDLLNKGEVQLDDLEITVLDEADQMADMGFLPVVKEILDQAKPNGQRLLFSATLDRGVDALVRQYLNNPKTHSLQNDRASVSTMEHYVLVMHPGDKDDITNQIAARNGKTILFVKTQRGADRLADKLAHAGVPVGALHGGKSQAVRTRTLALFKQQANAALVATDVAARGIHVDGISLVVHVDAPTDHKDYLHRSGRTARAGEAGAVVTLATTKQQKSVGGLTSRAGVTPKFVGVKPLDQDLMRITGAQEPSGIPYIAPIVENKGPNRGSRKPRPNSSERRRRPR
ncbi:DEAD/DEAH box helicase [Candidatus Planktophila lacus]|uniref:DEAD/DEAH box helicase n=1 Tax=Candidatus Planktophila lacus TaxID=1884913 RepID=UPI00167FE30F|nr:DEAD/DEAH box helicase [Candidatus Planktophila lacus]